MSRNMAYSTGYLIGLSAGLLLVALLGSEHGPRVGCVVAILLGCALALRASLEGGER